MSAYLNYSSSRLTRQSRSILLLALPCLLLLSPSRAAIAPSAASITQAFQANSASKIAEWFGETVDLQILDAQNVYGKAQAQVLLQDFLSENPVRGFSVAFTNSRGAKTFFVANMTSGGQKFRVNIFVQKKGGKQIITQIQITHANKH